MKQLCTHLICPEGAIVTGKRSVVVTMATVPRIARDVGRIFQCQASDGQRYYHHQTILTVATAGTVAIEHARILERATAKTVDSYLNSHALRDRT